MLFISRNDTYLADFIMSLNFIVWKTRFFPFCLSVQNHYIRGKCEAYMKRKEFLSTLMMLGGASLLPASASVLEGIEKMAGTGKDRRRIDPDKAVLISDIHISGELKDGIPVKYPYNPTSLNLRIKEILALRPLPAHVIVFGDVAWDYGLEEDYLYAKELLRPLEEAGIQVTMGLGNHDRRAGFFKVFPQYAEKTPVPGRAVSVVSLPYVDIVMLDSLAELPDLKPKQKTTVSGEISDDQLTWLKGYMEKSGRRAILASHHPLKEMPNLMKFIADTPAVAGYIYGHNHSWNKAGTVLRPRKGLHMVPTVALPATFYGDIGFAVMTTDSKKAVIEYSSKGYWWPQPVDNPPAEWIQRQEDVQNEKCTILL